MFGIILSLNNKGVNAMKKILSLVLVLVLMMSVAVMASAEGTAFDNVGATANFAQTAGTPSIDEAFNALSDFLKLEAFQPYISGFHNALSGFYAQFDLWLKAIAPALNSFVGGLLNSGIFG